MFLERKRTVIGWFPQFQKGFFSFYSEEGKIFVEKADKKKGKVKKKYDEPMILLITNIHKFENFKATSNTVRSLWNVQQTLLQNVI